MPQQLESNLAAALERTVNENPPPSNCPSSEKFLRELEAYRSRPESEEHKPFKHWPSELRGRSLASYNVSATLKILLQDSQWAPVEILSQEKIQILRTLAKEYAAEYQGIVKNSVQAAMDDFQNQRKHLREMSEKRGQNLDDVPVVRSLESFQRDYAARRDAIFQRLKLIDADYIGLVAEAINNAVMTLKDALREIEQSERTICNAYALPWEPSPLWCACLVFIYNLPMRIQHFQSGGNAGPAPLIEGIIKL